MLSLSLSAPRAAATAVARRALASEALTFSQHPFLAELGLAEDNPGVYDGTWRAGNGPTWTSVNPATGEPIARISSGNVDDYESCVEAMAAAKEQWASTPAPVRGEVVRQIGEGLREKKDALGSLISLEMGKIKAEGDGEVQESVDICDFALGGSRVWGAGGAVIPSERPNHFMMERWNALPGHVAIITAFNFPNAVGYWNSALSLVMGNTQIWKPSPSLGLTTIASNKIITDVMEANGFGAVATTLCGDVAEGEAMVQDPRSTLVSFTGSTAVGRKVSVAVAARFGKSILELGGNNAMVVAEDADLDMALRAIVFSAVGTAGQRCTTLRRLYLHESVYDELLPKLVAAYQTIGIGDPMAEGTLCGPLHNQAAVAKYEAAVEAIKAAGGNIAVGGNALRDRPGNFVEPTIAEVQPGLDMIKEEVFVPIMYVMKYGGNGSYDADLEEAIALNNDVPQGLSSSLITKNQSAVFKWTGPFGSDCGIANVNIGPSGAEIGGAFGGEKETGGGRESGSDAWKAYARRSTCTINFGDELPLAQGIKF